MGASRIACLILLVGGCAFDHYGLSPGGAPSDGAADAPVDSGGLDGGTDGAVDGPIVDASVDAGADAAIDASVDAAAPDAAADAAASDAPPCADPDTDPMCAGSPVLGDVSGDTPSTPLVAAGSTEAWYQVDIVENNDLALEAVTAQIDLVSPPGVDFDLYVTCASCADTRTVSSTNGAGLTDTLFVGRSDVAFTDVGFSILVEIRWISSTACGDWSLTVTGDATTSERPCN